MASFTCIVKSILSKNRIRTPYVEYSDFVGQRNNKRAKKTYVMLSHKRDTYNTSIL